MSAIRPPVPSPLFPSQTPSSPAGSSRSAFFQTALQAAAAPSTGSSVATPAPTPIRDTPVRSVTPRAAEGDPSERFARPGSLLDIRV
jgi:hypothetical protein